MNSLKKLILFTLLSFSLSAAFAQKSKLKKGEVPETVLKSFSVLFSQVDKPDWVMNGSDYQANFTVKFNDAMAVFNPEGKWLRSEFTIANEELHGGLPTAITTYIENNYKGAEISAVRIQLNAAGKVFMVILDPDDNRKTDNGICLYFAENGGYLRQEARK